MSKRKLINSDEKKNLRLEIDELEKFYNACKKMSKQDLIHEFTAYTLGFRFRINIEDLISSTKEDILKILEKKIQTKINSILKKINNINNTNTPKSAVKSINVLNSTSNMSTRRKISSTAKLNALASIASSVPRMPIRRTTKNLNTLASLASHVPRMPTKR